MCKSAVIVASPCCVIWGKFIPQLWWSQVAVCGWGQGPCAWNSSSYIFTWSMWLCEVFLHCQCGCVKYFYMVNVAVWSIFTWSMWLCEVLWYSGCQFLLISCSASKLQNFPPTKVCWAYAHAWVHYNSHKYFSTSEGDMELFTSTKKLCTWQCNMHDNIMSIYIPCVLAMQGLNQVKRCLRATSLAECQPIIRLKC